MIKLISNGNIFESKCEAWVNPVNCIGVMGAGLALAFKRKFPQMFKEYKQVCKKKKLIPGLVHVWQGKNPKYIINFPTKDDLSPSKLIYISTGLITLVKEVKDRDIKSIAIPALGSGLGGLNWKNVKYYLDLFSEDLPEVIVEVYEPLEDE
jgi:O-acetyl-ADP-ribose deacetylase (regulator of RNase III)